jgi:hypothetical protein
LVSRAAISIQKVEREASPKAMAPEGPNSTPRLAAALVKPTPTASSEQQVREVCRVLRSLHLLLRAERLYEKNHPRKLDSLDAAYDLLKNTAEVLGGIEIRIERGGLVLPRISDAHLPDGRGEMQALAVELQRAGIEVLVFSKKFHVGELDTLARLVKASLLRSEELARDVGSAWWPARLLEHRVEGISVNTQTERRVDTVLASLIAALVAYGGHSPREKSDTPIHVPDFDDLVASLRLLARLTPPLESERGLSPEEAARAIHDAMEAASHDTVRLLLSAILQYSPEEGELPQAYILRLSENLILEYLEAEFAAQAMVRDAIAEGLSTAEKDARA